MTEVPFRRESLGYLVNHVARLFEHSLAVAIAPYGVVPGQFAQLLALFEEDGLTQRELCDRVNIGQATMANTLKRMQRDGLVRSDPDPNDGRRIRVHLTEHARSVERQLIAAASAVNAAATAGLTEAEVDAYLKVTARLIDNLDA